jgi:hypothetical protein
MQEEELRGIHQLGIGLRGQPQADNQMVEHFVDQPLGE